MKKEERIDYLQWSVPEIPGFLGVVCLQRGSPNVYYKAAEEYPCGTLVMMGNRKTDNYLIQMPGLACDAHNMTKTTGRLAYALQRGGKFSRIDLAVTVDALEPLERFQEAVAAKDFISERFEQDEPKMIGGVDGVAQTIYLGDMKKRGKKGLFRAYNKGLEQGTNIPTTRFELEIRGKSATVAVRRLLLGKTISELIAAVVDLPNDKWWREIMGAPPETLPRYLGAEPRDMTAARWHWLVTQVAPALGKLLAIEEMQGTDNLLTFIDAVRLEQSQAYKFKTGKRAKRTFDI